MITTAKESWWTDFFDDTYADIGLVPESEAAERAVAEAAQFIVAVLRLSPGQTVLDQCCGIGRLSRPLAEMGIRVIGIDQAPGYVSRAQSAADADNLPAKFYAADALELVAPEPCNAAFNWFTSFGYHEDDAVNRRMLDRAYESLEPGGWYALDYLSMPKVLREFRPCYLDRFDRDGEELWVIQEPELDFVRGMIVCNWTFMRPDKSHEVRRVENRAYMPNELVALLRLAGFENIELFGSAHGEPFNRLSRRCIAIGQKTAG